jgi:hypothetical protein
MAPGLAEAPALERSAEILRRAVADDLAVEHSTRSMRRPHA